MKKWAFLFGVAAAMGAAVVMVSLALQRSSDPATLEDISGILDDCHDRVRRIEADLHRLKAQPELAG